MGSENLATVTRTYEGWALGDFTAGVAALDENVVLVLDPEMPEAGEHIGLGGIRDYMRRLLDAWESFTITAESFEEASDNVLVRVKQAGVGKDSGAEVGFSYFQLWTFRGGKVIRLESIKDEKRAREALGSP